MHVTRRTDAGLYVTGAKAHMTGGLNCIDLRHAHHEYDGGDRDYAVIGMVPATAPGFIYGRQSCDTRALEPGDIDKGNATYGGQRPSSCLMRYSSHGSTYSWMVSTSLPRSW